MAGTLLGRGYVYFAHRLSPLRDESGSTTIGYVLVLDDHTEREQLERERRRGDGRTRGSKIFEHFMPPQVFQELLRRGEKTGIAGRPPRADDHVRGHSRVHRISERHRPEQVVELLNGYLAAATDVVFEHHGTIDKFIGDAIMALFRRGPDREPRAPVGQGGDGDAAPLRRDARAPGQRASFGIGINTGQGVVGTIGAPQLMSYTVIGDVVNVAARLRAKPKPARCSSPRTRSPGRGPRGDRGAGSIYVKGRLARAMYGDRRSHMNRDRPRERTR